MEAGVWESSPFQMMVRMMVMGITMVMMMMVITMVMVMVIIVIDQRYVDKNDSI